MSISYRVVSGCPRTEALADISFRKMLPSESRIREKR
jgi:hypothetical protein